MAKKLKKLNYVENLITFISRMQSSNWVEEDGPVPPTPTTLTPFALNQYVQGGIINVEGDTTVLDTYLANFPTTYGSHKELIRTSDPDDDNQIVINIANTMSGDESWWENYVLYVGIGRRMFVYSTNAQHTEVPGAIDIPGGWNELNPSAQTPEEMFIPVSTNQEVELEKVVQVSVCDEVANDINGVYFGAIEGEPPAPTTFTAFTVNETSDGIDFGNVNNGDTNADLESALEDLSENTYVTFSSNDGISIASDDGNKVLMYRDETTSTDVVLYATGNGDFEGTTYTRGYQNLTDGKYTFDTQKSIITVSDNAKFEAINGVLFGNYQVGL